MFTPKNTPETFTQKKKSLRAQKLLFLAKKTLKMKEIIMQLKQRTRLEKIDIRNL